MKDFASIHISHAIPILRNLKYRDYRDQTMTIKRQHKKGWKTLRLKQMSNGIHVVTAEQEEIDAPLTGKLT